MKKELKYYEKELRVTNQTEFRAENVIKKRENKLCVKRKSLC